MVCEGQGVDAAVTAVYGAHRVPGPCRLDPAGHVVGHGQADASGRGHRQQVRVAQPVPGDGLLQARGQARGKARRCQVPGGVKAGEGSALPRQAHGPLHGAVAQHARDMGRLGAAFGPVVAQAQHHQRIGQPSEAQSDAAGLQGLQALLFQRPAGQVDHVVQHAHGGGRQGGQADIVEVRPVSERLPHQPRQVDGAQAATAVGRQGLLAARVGGVQGLAPGQAVVAVQGVQEQHPGLAVVPGRVHQVLPARAGAGIAGVHLPHEGVGQPDREVEVREPAGRLRVDERAQVGVVHLQHPHQGARACTFVGWRAVALGFRLRVPISRSIGIATPDAVPGTGLRGAFEGMQRRQHLA